MFNEYQKEACSLFKPVSTLTPDQVRLLDWALGLGGESGEVLDLLKHAICHKDSTLDKMELAKELGDVIWYVSAIATTCDIDLADVVALNSAKLNHRYGEAFSVAASADRHARETAFKDTAIFKCLKARINNTGDAPLNVFVIGPDGSGKTTFTRLLTSQLAMERIKCNHLQVDKVAHAHALLDSKIDVIYDRFYFPDELIYSAVKNIPLEADYVRKFDAVWEKLKRLNPVFIYIDADLEVLKTRSAAWEDDYISTDDLLAIKTEYAKFLNTLQAAHIPLIKIDMTDMPVDSKKYIQLLNNIDDKLMDYRATYGSCKIKGREDV